jgi:hypothetical protein
MCATARKFGDDEATVTAAVSRMIYPDDGARGKKKKIILSD